MPNARAAKQKFVPGTSRGARSAHTLLLQMAREAEELAAQAERIKGLRKAKRVTQPEVADAVGVTLRAYQAWEAGDSDLDPKNLKALAAYFDVSPDWIDYGPERVGNGGATPDPFAANGNGNGQEAMSGDDRLDQILTAVKDVHERLELLQAESAARDAEALKRIEELQRTIQGTRRRRRQ